MIKTMKALIKREYWEHRGAFLKAPIIFGIVILVITIGAYITGLVLANKSGAQGMVALAINEISNLSKNDLSLLWQGEIVGLSTGYLLVLFIVLFFFMLGSLFDDRKDQSILFWKSLPISDSMTVASKLLTAMFFVPIVFTGIYFLLLITMMIFASIAALFHGLNPIQLIWSPVNLFDAIVLMFSGIFVQMLWALPVYGWLIFCSAISKRRPFLFAIFIPAIIAFSWYWINAMTFKFTEYTMFTTPLKYLGHAILPYATGTISGDDFEFDIAEGFTNLEMASRMFSSLNFESILYGILFAGVFISVAVWLRRYRNTT